MLNTYFTILCPLSRASKIQQTKADKQSNGYYYTISHQVTEKEIKEILCGSVNATVYKKSLCFCCILRLSNINRVYIIVTYICKMSAMYCKAV